MSFAAWGCLLLASSAAAAAVDGEICGTLPASDMCGATLDFVLVVDNSYSLADRHEKITDFMSLFVDEFEMAVDDSLMCSFQILKPAEKKRTYGAGGMFGATGRPATPPVRR